MERVSNVSVRAPADCKTLMFIRGGDRLFSGLNSGEAFSPRTCRSIRILWQRLSVEEHGRDTSVRILYVRKRAVRAIRRQTSRRDAGRDTHFAQIPSTLIAALRETSALCSLALKFSCVQGLGENSMPSFEPAHLGFFAHIRRTAEDLGGNNCRVRLRRTDMGRHSALLACQVVVSDRLYPCADLV